MSAIRGAAFAAGLWASLGLAYAAVFAILLTLGQVVAYARGMRPALDYSAERRPRFTRAHFWGTVARTIGYTAAALIRGATMRPVDHAWAFAIRLRLLTGVVTGIGIAVNPLIEYFADNMPERRLGVFGVTLMLCGFRLQSVQYWLIVLRT